MKGYLEKGDGRVSLLSESYFFQDWWEGWVILHYMEMMECCFVKNTAD
jgi:hypothetical protein